MSEEKFTPDDLKRAADDLATIPYFPAGSRASVIVHLGRMCPHRRALRWVVDTAVARCREWPGLSELRGLLCTRFDAADGIDEPNCSIPGFTPEDAEARFLGSQPQPTAICAESRQMLRQLSDGLTERTKAAKK